MPAGQKSILVATAFVGAGIIGAVGTRSSKFTDDEVKAEITKLGKLCDLVGIRLSTGWVRLALFVYADDLPYETVIGKCHLIRDRLTSFKQFAMSLGWAKYPVFADVFFIFADSRKAFHFRQSVQEHCKHYEFFKKIGVLPWGVDLAARSVWGYKGLPLSTLKSADIESKLFSQPDVG